MSARKDLTPSLPTIPSNLTEEELHRAQQDALPDEMPPDNAGMEQTFEWMANRRAEMISVPRSRTYSRAQVAKSFQQAFELIGGVPRLAMWAHENPTEFFKLYSKLFPNQNMGSIHDSVIHVHSNIPKGKLDGVSDDDIEDAVLAEYRKISRDS